MDYQDNIRIIKCLTHGDEEQFYARLQSPDFDLDTFADFLNRHHLRDYVHPILNSDPARQLFPAHFLNDLERYHSKRKAHNEKLLSNLADIRTTLVNNGIDFLFLKGFYWGERFYGNLHRRRQSDLDLMVREKDRGRTIRVLTDIGFSRKPNQFVSERNQIRYDHALEFIKGDIALDLHWRLRYFPAFRIDYERVWETGQKFALGGKEYYTLSDENTLMFLIVSIIYDIERGAGKMKQLLDLYLALRSVGSGIDWESFLERRDRENLLKISVNVLAIILYLFECDEEFPQLAEAIQRCRDQIELRNREDALALMSRPRGNVTNVIWFCRVYPEPFRYFFLWILGRHFPKNLRKIRPWRIKRYLGILLSLFKR